MYHKGHRCISVICPVAYDGHLNPILVSFYYSSKKSSKNEERVKPPYLLDNINDDNDINNNNTNRFCAYLLDNINDDNDINNNNTNKFCVAPASMTGVQEGGVVYHPNKSKSSLLTHKQQCALVTVSVFAPLQLLLCHLAREEIPHRDMVTFQMGLLLVVVVILLWGRHRHAPILVTHESQLMRTAFTRISTLEVVFTIILPWVLLLIAGENNRQLLGIPHLFVFQAQIILEVMFTLADRGDFNFPFTIVANLYRSKSIIAWCHQTYFRTTTATSIPFQMASLALSTIAALLWLYGSLIFIPTIWFPCLEFSSKMKG